MGLGSDPLGYLGTPNATTTTRGKVRLATISETTAGLRSDIAVTPAGLAAVAIAGSPAASTSQAGILELAGNADAINQPIFMIKADARKRGAKITINLFRQHFPMKRYFDLGGKFGKQQGVELSGADLQADLVFEVAKNSVFLIQHHHVQQESDRRPLRRTSPDSRSCKCRQGVSRRL